MSLAILAYRKTVSFILGTVSHPLACLLWGKRGARLWAMLWRSPHGKKLMFLTSVGCGLPTAPWVPLEVYRGWGGDTEWAGIASPSSQNWRWLQFQTALLWAWWETWSHKWAIPQFTSTVSSQPAWSMAPSISSILLQLHSHIIRPLSSCRVELIFYPGPHPAVLFTFSIGKIWSQERFISVLVHECGIPDIRKSEGKVCIWMAVRRSGKSSQKSWYYQIHHRPHCPRVNPFPLQ